MATALERVRTESVGVIPSMVMHRVEDALCDLDTAAFSLVGGNEFYDQGFRQRTNKMAFLLHKISWLAGLRNR